MRDKAWIDERAEALILLCSAKAEEEMGRVYSKGRGNRNIGRELRRSAEDNNKRVMYVIKRDMNTRQC